MTKPSSRQGSASGVDKQQLLQRLMALETQVQAVQRQTEVQLNALMASIRRMSSLVAGELPAAAVAAAEAAAVPATPTPPESPPMPPRAVATAVPPTSPAQPLRIAKIGRGEITDLPAAPDPNDLPHLLPRAEISSAAATSQLRVPPREGPVAPPAPAPVPVPPLAPEPEPAKAAAPPDPVPATATIAPASGMKKLLERKVEQMMQWENGDSPAERYRTRSLMLTPEELAELRGGAAKPNAPEPPAPAKPAVTMPVAPPADDRNAAAAKPETPRRMSTRSPNVPYPDEIQQSKRLMFAFKQVVQELMDNPVIPGTHELIPTEMRDELSWYSRLILEDFLTMHDKAKRRATERHESVTGVNPNLTDPALFWDREVVAEYRTYRTTTFLEKFLDHLENEIRAMDQPSCYRLLDYLAAIMELKRLPVVPGETPFDPARHVCAEQDTAMAADTAGGLPIVALELSGYVDALSGDILRKAHVRLTDEPPDEPPLDLEVHWPSEDEMADEEDTQPLRQPVFHTPDIDDFAHEDTDDAELADLTAADELNEEPVAPSRPRSAAPSASGAFDEGVENLPIPPEVMRCQNQVFSLKMTVTGVLRDRRLPKSANELDAEIAEVLETNLNQYMQAFMALHKESMERAQARRTEYARSPVDVVDPNAFWEPRVVQAYREYRSKTFIETLLDRVEAKIVTRRLPDHQELIDHLAMEMELGRIGITPSVTRYDPERHELASANLPPNADLRNVTILAMVKSGYTDLSTGQVARRALVTVKLKPPRRSDASSANE